MTKIFEQIVLENYLKQQVVAERRIRRFLCKRAKDKVPGAVAYPPDVEKYMVEKLLYWPGLNKVKEYADAKFLKNLAITSASPRIRHSRWEHSGVLMRLGTGYRLTFYSKHGRELHTTRGGKVFPMPGTIDPALPVILVEGEMDALSCAAIGIKNVFATGGTAHFIEPKIKTYLLNVPEIILFFDADEMGKIMSGICPRIILLPNGNRALGTNTPQRIRRAGYAGKIKIAELPPVSETGCDDQDALIIAGKRDIVTAALATAREWVPVENERADA